MLGNKLSYYSGQWDTVPLGSIYLRSHILKKKSQKREFCFELVPTRRGERIYFIAADNAEDYEEWTLLIKRSTVPGTSKGQATAQRTLPQEVPAPTKTKRSATPKQTPSPKSGGQNEVTSPRAGSPSSPSVYSGSETEEGERFLTADSSPRQVLRKDTPHLKIGTAKSVTPFPEPSEWVARRATSGKIYYFNRNLGVVTWENPFKDMRNEGVEPTGHDDDDIAEDLALEMLANEISRDGTPLDLAEEQLKPGGPQQQEAKFEAFKGKVAQALGLSASDTDIAPREKRRAKPDRSQNRRKKSDGIMVAEASDLLLSQNPIFKSPHT